MKRKRKTKNFSMDHYTKIAIIAYNMFTGIEVFAGAQVIAFEEQKSSAFRNKQLRC